MEITLENIYYLFGVLFVVSAIVSNLFKKQKNKKMDIKIDVMEAATTHPSETINNSVKIAKENGVKLLDFIEVLLYLIWIFIGLFTKEHLLFILLIVASFVLPTLQSVVLNKTTIGIKFSKYTSIVSFIISSIIIMYIEYHHFFLNCL